jgi:glutaredoxin-like protein
MALLKDKDRERVRGELASLANPVKLIAFTQELACEYCRELEQLAGELGELSDQLKVEVYNFQIDKEVVARYRVDKIPAIVVEGDRDRGVRFYGIPMGYEFTTLLGAIKDAAARATGLAAETKAALRLLASPVHLQVFVTPT